jgi:hypothetical protein
LIFRGVEDDGPAVPAPGHTAPAARIWGPRELPEWTRQGEGRVQVRELQVTVRVGTRTGTGDIREATAPVNAGDRGPDTLGRVGRAARRRAPESGRGPSEPSWMPASCHQVAAVWRPRGRQEDRELTDLTIGSSK